MVYQLTWMPDVLLRAGLHVAECEGWRERGRADMGTVRGVMVHHTGTAIPGNMPTLGVLVNGRDDLPGPLANLGLGRDGTFYVVAAGRANHAGIGRFRDVIAGNASFVGIEAEHSGSIDVPWPEAQMEAYQRGVAALLEAIPGASVDLCVAHKEWALPSGRKVDPCFDMSAFRNVVSDYLQGRTRPPSIPETDAAGHRTLRRGFEGLDVEQMQKLLGVHADGSFGSRTEAALREWQRRGNLTADGICGPLSWDGLLSTGATSLDEDVSEQGPEVGLSQMGVDLIHSFEGCARRLPDGRFEAYPDPGSRTGRPWTIGWGSTGDDIARGTVWTQEECDVHFRRRMTRYVTEVRQALNGSPTSVNQFDALVSFHYNTGAIARATLTRKHCLGDFEGARREFGRWVRNDGKVMAGLVRRRQAEADLYATP